MNTAGFKETPNVSNDPLTILLKVNIRLGHASGHWSLRADMTGSSSIGGYFTLGPAYKNHFGDKFFYRLNLGAGWLVGEKDGYCLDAGMLLVQKLEGVKYLLWETQVKSNGQDVWYLARFNWQVLGAVGVGVRAQTNSLVGTYVLLGHENFSFMWFGYGLKQDEPKKTCIAYGVKVLF